MIGVMAYGALTMLLVLSITGRVVSEARAVNDSLTQVRAYWAAQGLSNYILSRAMGSGVCPASCAPSAPTAPLQSYLAEISPAAIWLYPEVSPEYRIGTNPTVTVDTATQPTWAYLNRVTFAPCPTSSGTPPPCNKPSNAAGPLSVVAPSYSYLDALRSLTATRPVEIRYCFVSTKLAACTPGAKNLTAGAAWQSITSVHRPSQ